MDDRLQLLGEIKNTLELLSLQAGKMGNGSNKDDHHVNKLMKEHSVNSLEELAKDYIDFTYENPTVYHVVESFTKRLDDHGFQYISEKEDWSDLKPGCYYTIRNGTNLVAFLVGDKWTPSRGVGAIGSHIDALTAKLKPASRKKSVGGYNLLGVAPYGGTLNHAWFDRDLGIAGRVLVKDDDRVKSTLINSAPQPIGRIPSLAPHFGEPALGPFDKEDQAVPVIGYDNETEETDDEITSSERDAPLYGKHDIRLLRYIAKLADCSIDKIQQLDLELFDVQKGTLGGLKNDFIFAPRLDDRLCSYAAIIALLRYSRSIKVNGYDGFTLVALFDNEEVGSLTRQGAKGGLLESVVNRTANALLGDHYQPSTLKYIFANSLIISADVNHLFNPNFANVYMEGHSPKPNVGVTLSLDPNAHMSTDVVGLSVAEEIARRNGDKLQYFQIKNNSRSGGTIGPSIASQTGARTIDLGIPQLSMHSIRAATGVNDVGLGAKFFEGFFKHWRSVYDAYGDL